MMLHRYTTPDPSKTYDECVELGLYGDPLEPIDVLMSHSDCDGIIAHAMCLPMAKALADVIERTPKRGTYDAHVPATLRFAEGLLKAHDAKEDVRFE